MTPDVEADLDAAVAAVKAAPPGREWTAGELAPHLPQHLHGPFWERMIDRYMTQELARPDAEETT